MKLAIVLLISCLAVAHCHSKYVMSTQGQSCSDACADWVNPTIFSHNLKLIREGPVIIKLKQAALPNSSLSLESSTNFHEQRTYKF